MKFNKSKALKTYKFIKISKVILKQEN